MIRGRGPASPLPVHLILVAAGKSLRAGGTGGTPKQFRATGRGMLLRIALDNFLAGDPGDTYRIASVTAAVPEEWWERVRRELSGLALPLHLAPAGDTRTASTELAAGVLQGEVEPAADDLVAVHDAARPFASAGLLARLVAAAAEKGGAIPGIPVADTIVHSDGGPARYLRRDALLAVQTPQVFRWGIFLAAHRWAAEAGAAFTDDGGLLAARGHESAVVAGEADNWKVTDDLDWIRAEALLRG